MRKSAKLLVPIAVVIVAPFASAAAGLLKELPGKSPAVSASSYASPRSVLVEYLSAINARDWPRVWRVGGRNLPPFRYDRMVAGFSQTKRDDLISFAQHADRIVARIAAHEKNGDVQYYDLRYNVDRGIIAGGYDQLISQ